MNFLSPGKVFTTLVNWTKENGTGMSFQFFIIIFFFELRHGPTPSQPRWVIVINISTSSATSSIHTGAQNSKRTQAQTGATQPSKHNQRPKTGQNTLAEA
jgi:hypothetical protein